MMRVQSYSIAKASRMRRENEKKNHSFRTMRESEEGEVEEEEKIVKEVNKTNVTCIHDTFK